VPSLAHSFDAHSTNTVTWHPDVSEEGDMLLARYMYMHRLICNYFVGHILLYVCMLLVVPHYFLVNCLTILFGIVQLFTGTFLVVSYPVDRKIVVWSMCG
jgi:hypothetical protein